MKMKRIRPVGAAVLTALLACLLALGAVAEAAEPMTAPLGGITELSPGDDGAMGEIGLTAPTFDKVVEGYGQVEGLPFVLTLPQGWTVADYSVDLGGKAPFCRAYGEGYTCRDGICILSDLAQALDAAQGEGAAALDGEQPWFYLAPKKGLKAGSYQLTLTVTALGPNGAWQEASATAAFEVDKAKVVSTGSSGAGVTAKADKIAPVYPGQEAKAAVLTVKAEAKGAKIRRATVAPVKGYKGVGALYYKGLPYDKEQKPIELDSGDTIKDFTLVPDKNLAPGLYKSRVTFGYVQGGASGKADVTVTFRVYDVKLAATAKPLRLKLGGAPQSKPLKLANKGDVALTVTQVAVAQRGAGAAIVGHVLLPGGQAVGQAGDERADLDIEIKKGASNNKLRVVPAQGLPAGIHYLDVTFNYKGADQVVKAATLPVKFEVAAPQAKPATIAVQGAGGALYRGESYTASVDGAPGATTWYVNDQTVAANPDGTLTFTAAGDKKVALAVVVVGEDGAVRQGRKAFSLKDLRPKELVIQIPGLEAGARLKPGTQYTAQATPSDLNAAYRWTVDGQAVPETGASLTFTPGPGSQVVLTCAAIRGGAKYAGTATYAVDQAAAMVREPQAPAYKKKPTVARVEGVIDMAEEGSR